MRTGDEEVPAPRQQRRLGSAIALSCLALVLALVAFLLLPTAHANQMVTASINGHLYTVSPGSSVESIASGVISLARPGSTFDITGDVLSMGAGRPVKTEVDGEKAPSPTTLTDGAVVMVAHGDNVLEAIAGKTQELPFKTVVEGEGAIVRLAQSGSAGEQTVYLGTASRKQAALFVEVAPKNEVLERTRTAQSGQKLVALTFDDGPGKWTQSVIDALAAKHVPATFFVLGSCAAGNREMIQRLRDAGHEVEHHSWGHPELDTLTPEQIRKEIERTEAVIGKGHFLRPPYGAYNATVASVASSMGYRLALWTVDTQDWKNRDADIILQRVKDATKPGAIILMHDGGNDRSQTVAAIPRVVDWLLANGYSLTTLDKLL